MKNIVTTQRYTHVSIARLRAVHAATHPGAALTWRGEDSD
jgi:site-specific recombinase XerD